MRRQNGGAQRGLGARVGCGQSVVATSATIQLKNPVDLCITQARYTQLHRFINYSQDQYLFICKEAYQRLVVRHATARQMFMGWVTASRCRCRSCCR